MSVPLALKIEGVDEMMDESALFTVLLAVYVAVCFGKIAHKHGRNPLLYGVLAIIVPVNLVILGYWAFSSAETIHAPLEPPSGNAS